MKEEKDRLELSFVAFGMAPLLLGMLFFSLLEGDCHRDCIEFIDRLRPIGSWFQSNYFVGIPIFFVIWLIIAKVNQILASLFTGIFEWAWQDKSINYAYMDLETAIAYGMWWPITLLFTLFLIMSTFTIIVFWKNILT